MSLEPVDGSSGPRTQWEESWSEVWMKGIVWASKAQFQKSRESRNEEKNRDLAIPSCTSLYQSLKAEGVSCGWVMREESGTAAATDVGAY